MAEVEQAVRSQKDDVGLVIDPDFAKDWHAGVPAKVEVVTDSTRRNADVPAARVEGTLKQYSQTLGALRMLARGINPLVGFPVGAVSYTQLAARRRIRARPSFDAIASLRCLSCASRCRA